MNALLPLTHVQNRIWLTDKVFSGNSYNNLSATIKIQASLDIHILERVIKFIVQNNNSFRLRFIEQDGEIFQRLMDDVDFELEYHDFTADTEACQEWINNRTQEPYLNLDTNLFHFAVLKLGETETWIYYNMHHLISDGTTIIFLSNHILSGYFNFLESGNVNVKKSSYLEYINNESNYIHSKRFIKDRQFWNQEFMTAPAILSISKNRFFNSLDNLNAKRFIFEINPEQRAKVESLCSQYQMGISSFLMSTVYITLYILTQEEDITINTFFANRTEQREKEITGAFTSTCPIRMQIDHNDTFKNFTKNFSQKCLSVLRHQKYPFNLLLEELSGEKRENLKSLSISMDYQYVYNHKYEEIVYELVQNFNGNDLFDLSVHFKDFAETKKLEIFFDYKTDYYIEAEISDFASEVMNVINNLYDNPENILGNLAYNPQKSEIILHQFNNTDKTINPKKLFKQLFEEQACKTGESVALTFNNQRVTYNQLNQLSNQLAFLLRKKGIDNGSLVGIYCNRSIELIVFILATIKAGGTYLPLDHEMPFERVKYMLSDSEVQILLTNQTRQVVEVYSEYVHDIVYVSDCINELSAYPADNIKVNCEPNDLIYVIYTSGSTGRPKGVMIEHLSVINLLYGIQSEIPFESFSKVLAVTTCSFDIFLLETLIPLSLGLNIILANDEQHNDPAKLNSLIINEEIDLIQMTPSRMAIVMEDIEVNKALQNVKYLLLGGEQLTDKLLKDIKRITSAQILNLYGPTEATVWACVQNLTDEEQISIGRPLANTKVYIMDEHQLMLPPEVVGEIVISGMGLARGYMNKEELTAKQFIPNPYGDSKFMYRTGDLGKWSSDGKLYIIGRSDRQVKVRGYRVELNEIESRILEITGIRGTAVILFEGEDANELAAYIVADKSITMQEIRYHLSALIPKYMIPKYFEFIDRIPLTANGKIDRKALPLPVLKSTVDIDFESDHIRRKVSLIWQEVLLSNNINIHADFFELGGHSLDAIKIISKINNEFQINLPISTIFMESSIDTLSKTINKAFSNPMKIKKLDQADFFPLSNSQMRFLILQSRDSQSTRFNLSRLLKISGVLNAARLQDSVDCLIERHRNLRSSILLKEGKFVQEVNEDVYVKIEEHQFLDDSELKRLLNSLNTKIDLKSKSLMKVHLLKPAVECFDHGYSYILFSFNHIIADGTSLNIILKDFFSIYSGAPMPKLSLEYSDYALWQNDFLQSTHSKIQRGYWKKKMSKYRYTELPKKLISHSQGYGTITMTLNEEHYEGIKEFCFSKKITLFVYLISALNICIYKLTRQSEVSFGIPVSGRIDSNLENTVGCFVNTILVQNELDEGVNISEYLTMVNSNLLLDLDNQIYPYDQIFLDNKEVQNNRKDKALYSILFNFLPFGVDEKVTVNSTTFELCEFGITDPKSDIELYTYFIGNQLKILTSYNKAMYDEDQINDFVILLNQMVVGLADDKVKYISELL